MEQVKGGSVYTVMNAQLNHGATSQIVSNHVHPSCRFVLFCFGGLGKFCFFGRTGVVFSIVLQNDALNYPNIESSVDLCIPSRKYFDENT